MKEPYEPSPLEIWRRCVDIQATRPRDEERKRREGGNEQSRPLGCKRVLRIRASSRIEIQHVAEATIDYTQEVRPC